MSTDHRRGWCPGALRPMASGDGLVVRVRPRLARLTAPQVLRLCALADRLGDGGLEMTNRANLQIYGVRAEDHGQMLEALADVGLLDADATLESRRNVLVAPDWLDQDDLTPRLTQDLYARLSELPDLPAKVGFAVDLGDAPVLGQDPADIRLERSADGLILRADGATTGRPVTEDCAIDRLIELAHLFAATRQADQRRVRAWVAAGGLPQDWQGHAPRPAASRPAVGGQGAFGAPFGRIEAVDLVSLMMHSGASALRITPWRICLVEGNCPETHPGFITDPDDPLLTTSACRGAPSCPQGTVDTRHLARQLAPHVRDLHVSGCTKGCARARASAVTVVGRNGTYDIVRNGTAACAPTHSGLNAEDTISHLTSPQ
ncbi:cobalamin biosynthesis protein CobG [Sagittula sp. SSi028]|uniref:cobalamin biosynthesis protein CobG n=1 Tax=Sagittula sp. SSi028 TaxID=3400636 RepID=UPI003AF41C44